MFTEVSNSRLRRAPGMIEPAARRAGGVDSEGPSRSRGRPKKPLLTSQPCREEFDEVAAGVITLAAMGGGAWAAAKERVRNWADREKGFAPATIKVLGFQLEHVNQTKGCDWHSTEHIARELGLTTRTIERAFDQLGTAGYILREMLSRRRHEGQQTMAHDAAGIGCSVVRGEEGPDRKFTKDPTGKVRRTRQSCREGPDENVG